MSGVQHFFGSATTSGISVERTVFPSRDKTRSNLRRLPQMSHSTPIGQIQFEEADPHTPVNSQRRLVTPPPVSSKVQRSGLVHIIGKEPPKIPNLFGDDFATIVPEDDSQEQ